MNQIYRKLIILFVFCLGATTLVLSSCGDDDSSVTASPVGGNTPVLMRGFLLSVNEEGLTDCTDEQLNLYVDEGIVDGRPNVRLEAGEQSGADFSEFLTGVNVGVRVPDNDQNLNPETIATSVAFLIPEDFGGSGQYDRPNSYFLNAVDDNDITGNVYAGYWTGYAYRPEVTPRPNVICPYVFVPAGLDLFANVPSGQCGVDIDTPIHPALAKYLEDPNNPGMILPCYDILDGNGQVIFPPTPRDIDPRMGIPVPSVSR